MSWSYSKLLDFEQCPYRYKLRYVDKRDVPANEAADRGTQIHAMAETFVNTPARTPPALPKELSKFDAEFQALRVKYHRKLVSLEGEWGFDTNWLPTDYKTAWLRMKADAVAFADDGTNAIVIDFKTGKKFGNELKHGEQVQLYALATAIRNPKIKELTVELWYLDKDELTTQTYTRTQALNFIKPFDKRARRIEQAERTDTFTPRANAFTCKWCPFGPDKTGACPHGTNLSTMTIADYRRKFP